MFENTAVSAWAHASASSGGTGSPACSARTLRNPSSIAACVAARLFSSGSAASPASSAAFSFSHTRGTPPKRVGRASIVCANTCVGSGQVVIVAPEIICS